MKYHTKEYVEFLQRVTPHNIQEYSRIFRFLQMTQYIPSTKAVSTPLTLMMTRNGMRICLFASERQFSTAGDIYKETRSCLTVDNADRLIFIMKNKNHMQNNIKIYLFFLIESFLIVV